VVASIPASFKAIYQSPWGIHPFSDRQTSGNSAEDLQGPWRIRSVLWQMLRAFLP